MNLRPTRLRVAALAVAPLLVVAGCGSDDAEEASEPSASSSAPEPGESSESASDDGATESPSEEAESEAAAPSGDTPAWAYPTTTPGEMIATVEAGDLTVDVYQVGTATADDTGSFVDPDTNTPLIEVGDTLVFVNYVVTNNGDDLDLGSSLVSIDATYDDWPYLGGMDGLSSDELLEQQGVNDDGIMPGTLAEPPIYTLGAGQSFSFGENFEYQPGSGIEFEVTAVPVDAEGELLSDQRIEGTGSGTIS